MRLGRLVNDRQEWPHLGSSLPIRANNKTKKQTRYGCGNLCTCRMSMVSPAPLLLERAARNPSQHETPDVGRSPDTVLSGLHAGFGYSAPRLLCLPAIPPNASIHGYTAFIRRDLFPRSITYFTRHYKASFLKLHRVSAASKMVAATDTCHA